MWKLRKVKGKTMTPALVPGAVVLTAKRTAQVGDIVLAENTKGEVLKRVVSTEKTQVILANDTGAPHKEVVVRNNILGVVVFALPGAATAPKPHKPYARVVATLCALVFITMATAQLFGFDKFIELLDENWLPHGISGVFLGAVLVSLTVLSLPYLMHMALSWMARLLSQIAGWVVALLWLGIGFMTQSLGQEHVSTGHLGAFVDTPPGLWTVIFGFALLLLVAASSWLLGGTKYIQVQAERTIR